jgi:DNA-binding SARP family transcriptional activator
MDGSTFRLRTLGSCALIQRDRPDGAEHRLLGPGKPLALLAYCAAHAGTDLPRRQLVELFWADTPPDRRRQNIRQVIYRLRTLGEAVLEAADEEQLRIGSEVASDRTELLRAIEREDLDGVLACYLGPYLPDLSIPGGDAFEDWAAEERDRLERLVIHVARTVLFRETNDGRTARVRELLERVIRVVRPSLRAHALYTDILLAIGEGRAAQRYADQLAAALSGNVGGVDIGLDVAAIRGLITRARTWQPLEEPTSSSPLLDMVGRESPFTHVISAMRRAAQGSTEVVVLGGVAGIGKSRILEAVATRARNRQGATVLLRASPAGRAVPYSLVGEVAGALAVLPGAAGIHTESARELAALDPRLATTYRVNPSITEGGEAIRRRALALFDLLEATTEQQPVTLLLDDLHWCDPLSRHVLETAVAKADSIPLLVVGSARGVVTDWLPHPRVHREILLPLSRSDSLEALRSSGDWPETPESERFLTTLVDSANGVPHDLTERLALAIDRGILTRHGGRWEATDWDAASAIVSVSSPLDHRLTSCQREERILLLHLALLGGTIDMGLAERSLGPTGIVPDAVGRALEGRGLLVRMDRSWQATHDLVGERMLALSTPEEQRDARQALAEALAASGTDEDLTAALRLAVAGDLEDFAIRIFRQHLYRRRDHGDRRRAEEILTDAVGTMGGDHRADALVRAMPWHLRNVQARRRIGVLMLGVLLGIVAGLQWWTERRPALAVSGTDGIFTVALAYGNEVRKVTPPLQVHSLASNPGGRVIRVELASPRGADRILAGGTAVTDSMGTATFVGLRIRTLDSAVTLRFSSPAHEDATATVSVSRNPADYNRLQLYGGELSGHPINGRGDSLLVAPGELLRGVLQFRYTTGWLAASVWLSAIPTWGDPAGSFEEPIQLVTPVHEDVVDVPIDLTAPVLSGQYWILFAMDAEDRGGFIASGTNWLVGKPLWNDGNDFRTLPDSVIERIGDTGTFMARRAYPADWEQHHCGARQLVQGQHVKYCYGAAWVAPLRIIVKAPGADGRRPGLTPRDTSPPPRR